MEINMRICYFKNLFLYAFRFLTDCNLGNHFHIIIGLNSSTAWKYYTGNDVYSGDRFCGNDDFSGLKTPDHAILFTVSGITAIADKKFGDF